MLSAFKYRPVATLLAGVFVVFTIGIPVVLASCPMMKASMSGACCSIKPAGVSPILKSQRDYSCCRTIIAADRNRTEFLQAQNDEAAQLLNYSTCAILFDLSIFEPTAFSKFILNDTHSPPLVEDIPIFTSSLLI